MSVHLRTPGELIAALPALLGFHPVDSVVAVGVTLTGRVAPIVRVDRSECLIPEVAQEVATTIAGHLARARAASVVLVSFRHPGSQLGCAALDTMRVLLERHVEVVDCWVAADGRFRSPDCADPRCCPDAGRPVPADAPESGRDSPRNYSSYVSHSPARDTAPASRRKAARAAFTRASRARDKAAHTDALVRWRAAQLDAWMGALARVGEGVLPTDAQAGRLAAGLCDLVVRDAAVIAMIPGRRSVAEALCADPAAEGVREALSAMIRQDHAVAPEPTSVTSIVALAEHLAWLCDEHLAPGMTIAGLALWWSGDDASAEHAIMCALGHEPGYRLAELVACALEARLPPGWLAAA